MAVKFAGSRNVDERRRRRLASEGESPMIPVPVSHGNAGYWKLRRPQEGTYEQARSPIASLIPPSRVRIWLLCIGLPALLFFSMFLTRHLTLPAEHPLLQSLNFEDGFAWRFFTGLLLMGCGAVCWLISWFRSASVRDFNGCFKSWYWSGWIFLIFGMVAGTGLHTIAARMIGDYARIEVPLLRSIIWLAPMLALLIDPLRSFVREMWHCRRSWSLLLCSCLAAVAYGWLKVVKHEQPGLIAQADMEFSLCLAVVTTSALMFSALLSQTHYVMYVSSDPVPKRQSWIFGGVGIVLGAIGGFFYSFLGLVSDGGSALLVHRRQRHQTEDGAEESEEQVENKKPAKRAKSPATPPKTTRTRAKAKQKEVETPAAEETAETEQKQTDSEKKKRSWFWRSSTPVVAGEGDDSAEADKKEKPSRSSRRAKPVVSQQAEKEEAQQQEDSSDESSSTESKSRSKPRIRVKTAAQNAELVAKPAPPAPVPEPVKPQATIPISSADEDDDDESWDEDGQDRIDPDSLKGLSKKERRRLRKQHRDQSRAKAG
ncbi:MAG: hypothetical protein KDA78_01830 [Planctomycetaceae bacterium]|nr:hypothetical protein [Planctomycetaceae bacterium]